MRGEVAMGGGDHPHVDPPRQALAEPPHLALLQHPQQHALGDQRQVADLVEEDGAAVRGLEDARAVAVGAGEGAAGVAEEVGEQQGLRQRGAVDRHERRRGARARAMDPAGDQLLAGAALAEDQDRQVAGREARDPIERRGERRALPDQPRARRDRGRAAGAASRAGGGSSRRTTANRARRTSSRRGAERTSRSPRSARSGRAGIATGGGDLLSAARSVDHRPPLAVGVPDEERLGKAGGGEQAGQTASGSPAAPSVAR